MNPFVVFILTKLASTVSLVVVIAITMVALLNRHNSKGAAVLFVCTLGMMLSVTILKEYFKVARPGDALISISSYAFPSGHAAGATFLAIILGYLSWRLPIQLRILAVATCALAAVSILISRVFLHVHTPLQVTAGFFVGLLFGLLFIYFMSPAVA